MLRRFGEKLRYLRHQHGMLQTELARRLGIAKQSHISLLELGRREPSLDMALSVSGLFAVTVDYLLRDTIPVEASADYIVGENQLRQTALRLFGAKLRYLRSQRALSQTDLAEELAPLTQAHISFLEAGRKEPSVDLVLQIADQFGVTIDYLVWDSIDVTAVQLYNKMS